MHVLYMFTAMQIIFESLPISSSGNLLLWMPLLPHFFPSLQPVTVAPEFDFLLHIPTLFILAAFFFRSWYTPLTHLATSKNYLVKITKLCFLADTVTVLFYFFWKAVGTTFFPLWLGFFITTLLLFSLPFVKKAHKSSLQSQDALLLGCVQGISLLPGISRFASTYVVAAWLGYSPTKSFRYSFLLEVPLLGAAAVKVVYLFVRDPHFLPSDSSFYLVVLGSTLLSFCVLSAVFVMVRRRSLWLFGFYTAAATALAILL